MPRFRTPGVWGAREILAALLSVSMLACLYGGGPGRTGAGAQVSRGRRPSGQKVRVRAVPDTTRYPWSAICKVVATFPDDTTVEGSGTMVGPHHCITALHLLYNTKTRTAATRVRIVPGFDEQRLSTKGLSSRPFGTSHLGQFLFWEPHDIAILVTSSNIGEVSSWMTVGSRTDRELLGGSYSLAGYTGAQSDGRRQAALTTLISKVEGDHLTFNTDNVEGLDGGPIFERKAQGRAGEQDVWAIVGVQTGPGRGSRIPAEMRRLLDKFLHDNFTGVKAKIPIPKR